MTTTKTPVPPAPPSITLRLVRNDYYEAWSINPETNYRTLVMCYSFANAYFRTYHPSHEVGLADESKSILLTLSNKPLPISHQQEVPIRRQKLDKGLEWSYATEDSENCYIYSLLQKEISKLFPSTPPDTYVTLYVSIETTDNLGL